MVDFEVQLNPKSMPTVVQPSSFPPVMQPSGPVRQSTSPSVTQPLQRVKQLRGQAGTIDAEGEFLVDSGRAVASAGSVVAQPMTGFGQGWSGNAQLFWHGASGGATLDLTVDVTAEGVYAVDLYATKAPDYGDVTLSANGQASGTVIGGYAPGVAAPTPMNVGNFNFKAGANTVRLKVVGKAPQSSGYFMGIDRIRLRPVDR